MTRRTPGVRRERIHLVTCVGVDTEYDHLPHFLEHYLRLGIPPTNFHVIVNSSDADSPNLERARATLSEWGTPPPEVWIADYTSDAMWARRRALQARAVASDDWVVSADVDELHEYPEELTTLLAECERRRVNCVQGVLVDRLAAQGRLVPVETDRPIGETFPIEADVQCTIGQQGERYNWYGTVKAMVFRGALFPSRGGHFMEAGDVPVRYLFARSLARFPDIGQARFRFALPLRVHHFKWTASMPATVRHRLATPGVSPAGAEYGQKILAYLERNEGICLADVPVRSPGATPGAAPAPSWRRRLAYLRSLDKALTLVGLPRRLARRVLRRED